MWKSLVLFVALALGIVSGLRAEEVTDYSGMANAAPSVDRLLIAE